MNSLWVTDFPWSGTYYGGINTVVKADAYPGFVFDHWESINHPFTDPENPIDTLRFETTDTLVAFFRAIEEDEVDPPIVVGYDGIHVPNAFTPNNDGNNDEIRLFVGDDVELLEFIIYDRWGNLVFRTDDKLTMWDGTFKGKLLNTGVYTYYLKYLVDVAGEQVVMGNITLMQ
ncbi:gliding motility-associated C-terminal domain-containing protein, partial [Crocinitomix sp.]|nr:gliding motility-associated C-terminal domain-containing protein [Crocinitomix sp.]